MNYENSLIVAYLLTNLGRNRLSDELHEYLIILRLAAVYLNLDQGVFSDVINSATAILEEDVAVNT